MKTSGTKDPDMNPCSYTHVIFDKVPKRYNTEKTTSSTIFFLRKLDLCMQKIEIRSMSFTLYKYQLKVDKGP
jgi:hypothetical protein